MSKCHSRVADRALGLSFAREWVPGFGWDRSCSWEVGPGRRRSRAVCKDTHREELAVAGAAEAGGIEELGPECKSEE